VAKDYDNENRGIDKLNKGLPIHADFFDHPDLHAAADRFGPVVWRGAMEVYECIDLLLPEIRRRGYPGNVDHYRSRLATTLHNAVRQCPIQASKCESDIRRKIRCMDVTKETRLELRDAGCSVNRAYECILTVEEVVSIVSEEIIFMKRRKK